MKSALRRQGRLIEGLRKDAGTFTSTVAKPVQADVHQVCNKLLVPRAQNTFRMVRNKLARSGFWGRQSALQKRKALPEMGQTGAFESKV